MDDNPVHTRESAVAAGERRPARRIGSFPPGLSTEAAGAAPLLLCGKAAAAAARPVLRRPCCSGSKQRSSRCRHRFSHCIDLYGAAGEPVPAIHNPSQHEVHPRNTRVLHARTGEPRTQP